MNRFKRHPRNLIFLDVSNGRRILACCSNCRRVFEVKREAVAPEIKDAIIREIREEFLQHTCHDTTRGKVRPVDFPVHHE